MTRKILLLLALTAVAIAGCLFIDPVPQNPAYHDFADQRRLWNLPNALNVLSNLPLILVGVWGAVFIRRSSGLRGWSLLRQQYLCFFAAVAVTGLGSCYYHYHPTNETLFWDRLPMTVAFMSFFAAVITELAGRRAGVILFWPLLLFGMLSVVYWAWSEHLGRGDLRFYALVQFVPVVLVPLMLWLFRPPENYAGYIVWLLIFYLLAKLFEVYDGTIYSWYHLISGHTLKHLFSAAGVGCILKMLYQRHPQM